MQKEFYTAWTFKMQKGHTAYFSEPHSLVNIGKMHKSCLENLNIQTSQALK